MAIVSHLVFTLKMHPECIRVLQEKEKINTNHNHQETGKKLKSQPNRKYDESYLQWGFL